MAIRLTVADTPVSAATSRPASISTRLFVGTALVLAVFVVLTALSVSYSVHQRAETALVDRLQGLVYGILGAAEIVDGPTLKVNEAALPDQRLNRPTAGLFAEIIGFDGQPLWQSRSSIEVVPPTTFSLIGQWEFQRIEDPRGDVHDLQFTSLWELGNGEELPFIVHVVAPAADLAGQLRRFDRTLWVSLLVSAGLLLVVQLLVLARSLAPLKRVGEQLASIENGERDQLDEHLPHELHALARNINTLLASERHRHRQYRHLLDDLAHSLKTPISILRNLSVQRADDPVPTIEHQTDQMRRTLAHYLQRASTRTAQYLAPPLAVAPVAGRIARSLEKLYVDPPVHIGIELPQSFLVRIADVDLHEIVGNILENACKYGARNVLLTPAPTPRTLWIDDDGPGFPDHLRSRLTERGVRADARQAGEGLGLAAARELMASYGGALDLADSDTGGARVVLRFR